MPRPDVSEARKAQILDAARRVFAAQAFSEVKMQDIAQEAGLSVGGVYWYYKSKDQLIAAILQENATAIRADLDALAAMDAPAQQRLETFFRQILDATDQLAELYVTGAKLYAMTSPDPEMRRAIESIGRAYHEGLATLITQGIARGEFRPAPAQDVATALIGLYEGLMLLWSMDPQGARVKDALQVGASLILEGLKA